MLHSRADGPGIAGPVDGLGRSIAARSADAFPDFAESAIELLFIAGSHDDDQVDLDFRLWTPELVVGGIRAEERTYKGARYRPRVAVRVRGHVPSR